MFSNGNNDFRMLLCNDGVKATPLPGTLSKLKRNETVHGDIFAE
jgi:hypothetical protein